MLDFCGCTQQGGNSPNAGHFMGIDENVTKDFDIVYSRNFTLSGNLNLLISLDATHRFDPREQDGPIILEDFGEPVTLSVRVYDINGSLIPNPNPAWTIPVEKQWNNYAIQIPTTNGLGRLEIIWTHDDIDDYYEDFALDNIKLIAKDGTPTKVDAVLTDKYGNIKSTFCLGEEIFLDARSSTSYQQYFLAIREFDELGNEIHYARTEPFWQPGHIPYPLNIREVNWFVGPGDPIEEWMFCTGEYQVQLAISNAPCSNPWEEILLDFNVVCCSDQDPTFTITGEEINGNLVLYPEHYDTYDWLPEECFGQSWCIYSSLRPDGPYLYLTTFEGPTFQLANPLGTLDYSC